MRKQESYLAGNLKFLRERQKKTQTEVAATMEVTRAKINAFENGVNSNPTVEDLGKFTGYFKISVDSLLWVNLKRLTELQLRNLEAGNDEYVMGTKIRVLATTVDSHNKDNIEIVPIRAKAGYATGYGNPDFVETLPTFQLPILSSNRKYRMFQIEGDSMLPIPDKSFVIGEYVEDWNIKGACILLTREEGIIFKEITGRTSSFMLHSLNPNYRDFEIPVHEVLEIWRFKSYLCDQFPAGGFMLDMVGKMLVNMAGEKR